jgi:hypothetical protein
MMFVIYDVKGRGETERERGGRPVAGRKPSRGGRLVPRERAAAFDRGKNSFGAPRDTVSAGKDSLGSGKDKPDFRG